MTIGVLSLNQYLLSLTVGIPLHNHHKRLREMIIGYLFLNQYLLNLIAGILHPCEMIIEDLFLSQYL
ncbi:hypothetical protein C1646_706823 [Rhizophagus diaphanus]|nr:hypothetical protein C1646_706823 [Rhizophagus diaphanus] [Rhizophagus sp. MUCL 43196]